MNSEDPLRNTAILITIFNLTENNCQIQKFIIDQNYIEVLLGQFQEMDMICKAKLLQILNSFSGNQHNY